MFSSMHIKWYYKKFNLFLFFGEILLEGNIDSMKLVIILFSEKKCQISQPPFF